jgi:hypothetical protein
MRAQLALEERDSGGIQGALKDVQEAGVIPPGVAQAIVEFVVDRHRFPCVVHRVDNRSMPHPTTVVNPVN